MNNSLVQRFFSTCDSFPSRTAQLTKDEKGAFRPCTFGELREKIFTVAHFLKNSCGVKKDVHITLLCDNRADWIVFDMAIQLLRAVDVPRGTDTNSNEIGFIIQHSDSVGCIFENYETFENLVARAPHALEKISFVIFIEDAPTSHSLLPEKTFLFKDILAHVLSTEEKDVMCSLISLTSSEDMATIIYTSGTTAVPKGVCLTQGAFEVQVDKIVPEYIPLTPGIVFLSILPLWHAYAREILYVVLCSGAVVAYSQPIGKVLLEDLLKAKAQYLTSVPRIWEGVHAAIHRKVRQGSAVKKAIFTIAVRVGYIHSYCYHMMRGSVPNYKLRLKWLECVVAIVPYIVLYPVRMLFDTLVFKKIRKLLGKDFLAGVSGGGALPSHVDGFFEAAKIKVLEGYGLTETGPVLSVRKYNNPEINSVGKLFPRIESKIINSEGRLCNPGEKGVLYLRGDQIMMGYYKNQETTDAVRDKDGWLNTGDLVMQARDGCLKILGREKDIIVLSSGENVEPTFIENLIKMSSYIEHVIIVGQERKYIAALIVPNREELECYAESIGLAAEYHELICHEKIIALITQEINRAVHHLTAHEKVNRFVVLKNTFEVGEELTQTLKMKRNFITTKYNKEIDDCYL